MAVSARTVWLVLAAAVLAGGPTGRAEAASGTGAFAVPLPANVTIHDAPCPVDSASGCSDDDGNVYVNDRRDRWTLAHEVGHVYLKALSPYWRGALMDRLGFDPYSAWDRGTGDRCWGRRCPSEIAADAYAACALRLDPRPRRVGRAVTNARGWDSSYGYAPTRRQHRRFCAALRRTTT